MGWVYRHSLGQASKHVLNVLKEKTTIRYSDHYYDGTTELHERVAKEMGFEETYHDEFPILVDIAVGQLEREGLVATEILTETMSDGEPDYTITLTEAGKAFVARGDEFPHWDMDL